MKSSGSSKIWILVPDWSRFKSMEPNADHVTRKIGPLYFKIWFSNTVFDVQTLYIISTKQQKQTFKEKW